jgi:delta-aminolevulinic acid dehydratase/porphobilinogen synthase
MLILKCYIILQKDALGKAADDAATPVVKALLRLREIFPELILACDVSILC